MTNRSFPGLGAGLMAPCLTMTPALAQQLPPPQVSVQDMTPEALPVVNELPGRVAAKLRFRPILMTSLAFTLGVVPLAIATGPSAASQNAIGTGVIGGMVAAGALAIFFVPVFFVFVLGQFSRLTGRGREARGGARAEPHRAG